MCKRLCPCMSVFTYNQNRRKELSLCVPSEQQAASQLSHHHYFLGSELAGDTNQQQESGIKDTCSDDGPEVITAGPNAQTKEEY